MTMDLDHLLEQVSRDFAEIETRYGTGARHMAGDPPPLRLLTFDEPDDRSQTVAALNDQFRTSKDGESAIPGFRFCSPSLVGKGDSITAEIEALVRQYGAFTAENDPKGEHDQGIVNHLSVGDVVWQIDCYETDACEEPAKHPDDPNRSYRVLAMFLADDVT